MPFITDYTDFIEITENQKDRLFDLCWRSWLSGLMGKKITREEYVREQLEIVPDSEGYQFIVPRFEKRMYRDIEI